MVAAAPSPGDDTLQVIALHDLTEPVPLPAMQPGTRVEVTIEDEPPFVVRWDRFQAENADDEGIDWPAIGAVVIEGGTWQDGGGASPYWSVRLAP